MEKVKIKSALIASVRSKLLETIALLEATIADTQQQANDYGPPKDRYDSFRTQLMRRRDLLAQQLSKEMNELQVIDKLESMKNLDHAAFGAVVLTQDQNYFLSIGLGKLEVDSTTYFAESPIVPISQALLGKKKNETFEFRGKKTEILDVF